ncbi:UPF0176 protein [Sphingomonas metalli]|uniref:tRNA uridine(34) hydroxylase n=1 Tax=Sphingomonas metalli TaxID=1779358 RepID=A0A916SU38_9SPHN|nr:rhodanese-related sulfurtransferase [Sphingomonas metalli]GGB17743.1 UPF0176 protein [Sphingomonas metalli]
MSVRIAALYRFTRFEDPAWVRDRLHAVAESAGVRGTLLIAGEGINGTVAGPAVGMATLIDAVRSLPGCGDIEPKYAEAEVMPFHRLKVRLKAEIVTMGVPDIDPVRDAGHYVEPAGWNALIDDPDTIVIDTRNAYEVAIGSFRGAVDPGTESFRDFPEWVRTHRDELAGRRVAMFCTGGIRCEKATALMKAEGVLDVHHLEGGILRYLEEVPAQDSRWQGECFVFDERVAVGHGLVPGTHELCRGCRMPVSPADRDTEAYVAGFCCPRCHDARSEVQRRGYAERHRQTQLAAARGAQHVGDQSKHR